METVEIDKKIASLKEEIEKLEKQKNDSYKKHVTIAMEICY